MSEGNVPLEKDGKEKERRNKNTGRGTGSEGKSNEEGEKNRGKEGERRSYINWQVTYTTA